MKGDNTYKLPHMGKDKLLTSEGKLPISIRCDPVVITTLREAFLDKRNKEAPSTSTSLITGGNTGVVAAI